MRWPAWGKKTQLDPNVALRDKLIRRDKYTGKALKHLHVSSYLFLVVGILYILAIPLPQLGKGIYVSENALQPAHVGTYWTRAEVKRAEGYTAQIEQWIDLSSSERCQIFKLLFSDLGLPTSTQHYQFDDGTTGCNTYATIRAPKTDGSESVVLAASWKSRDAGRINVRGVASLLELAHHLSKFSLWSKDIIFLIGDDYVEGTHAFVSAVHQVQQRNLHYDPLNLESGPIWAALHIDFPHHSFDRIGLFFGGVNGLLPNLDLITASTHILKWVGAVPSVLHDAPQVDLHQLDLKAKYKAALSNVWQQVSYGALGKPSGPEGVYLRYRIDALALYAVPAEGPFGFYQLGRSTESILRSINNLLERFHASAFLYIMTGPRTFVPLAHYIAAPVVIGVALTIKGLYLWHRASQRQGIEPGYLVSAIVVVLAAQVLGFWSLKTGLTSSKVPFFSILAVLGGTAFQVKPQTRVWLEPINLLLAGMAISVSATLNVSCAILFALTVGMPLMARPLGWVPHLALVLALNPFVLFHWAPPQLRLLEDWQRLDTALVPLSLLCVLPLQMPSAILSLSTALDRFRKGEQCIK